MHGKVVVITGATSGIGEVAAQHLADMGARIVLVARDKTRAEAALTRLRNSDAGISHSVHYGDLSRISEMKRLAVEIAAAEPRIDVLINNAGAMFSSRRMTEDKLELTFAVNHMAYFVLTHGLRERLLASSPARIVNNRLGCSPRTRAGFRGPTVSEGILRGQCLWTIQALQYPVHPRTFSALAGEGGRRELPASRLRCLTIR